MTVSYDTPLLKRCSRCKRYLPAKFPFFTRTKFQASGLRSNCRGCKYGWTNDEFQIKVLEHVLLERGYKRCVTCLEAKPFKAFETKREGVGGKAAECKECLRPYKAKYYQENKERFRQRDREWRKKNPEAYAKLVRSYQKTEKYKQRNKIQNHAYTSRKKALPFDFTREDWEKAKGYFEGACAVCGRKPDNQYVLAIDHWIPLSKGGPTTVNNIVPLCHGRKNGRNACNNSKKDRMPAKWLLERFGEPQASEILARIEAYFEWVKTQK